MPKLKTGPKVVLLGLLVLGLVFGAKTAANHGLIPSVGIGKSSVPTKAGLPDVKEALVANVEPLPLPTEALANVPATLLRGEVWEWNAQSNLLYANGGPLTTQGSLMAKRGVNLSITRQDDNGQMQADLIACAKEIHDGATQCTTGANFVIIMGDGSGQFLAALNPQLKKLGPNWIAKVIGATGYSRGEDAFLAPPEVAHNAQAARGLLVAGVLRDGDWNIALKWEGDNNIPNNPDEKTYDPDAVNWVNAADYLKAAEAYNSGQCEDRKVVHNGRLTGETKSVCVNAVVTWTPGDVNIVHGKGGLVKVVSSKQYRSQMPAVILGPEAFFQNNREEISNMLAATFEAADQMKAYPEVLRKAGDISAKVYNDQDGKYWTRYFNGVTEKGVPLGGSAVNNMADEKILFGLQPGSNDNFRATYTVFAAIATQQYPQLFKDSPIPPVAEIEDKSFIAGAEAVANTPGAVADTPDYEAESGGRQISSRSYAINFDTNRATFTPEGEATMHQLLNSLAITGMFIKVDGYTDNQGAGQVTRSGVSVNQALSEARAQAVKTWLQSHAPSNFPDSRFAVAGHGANNPVADNNTAEGRAQNRRVQVTLTGN
jgi:outer membrane protein OmpA-like peptidoglycan-associated protein